MKHGFCDCESYEYCGGKCCGYGKCTCTVVTCPECGHRDFVTPADPTAHWQRLDRHRYRVHGLTVGQRGPVTS
jgi:hypothetical protein